MREHSQIRVRRAFRRLLFGIVATAEGLPGLGSVTASPGLQDKYLAVAADDTAARAGLAGAAPGADGLFTRFALDLAAQRPGRAVAVLQAGCTTAGPELDLDLLRAFGHDLDVSLIDDETAASRAAVAVRPELGAAKLGELRLLPLRPRSYDIVQCSLLLHRVRNADMVLGRLAAAVRPGGLLLLRMADPGSAFGFLDRRLPRLIRTIAWRRLRTGQPGPYPACYEPVASARGIEAFMSRHGLSIAHRGIASSARSLSRPAAARVAGQLLTVLSRGRLAADHDELCYVIRRPEDRFARVLP
jgi:SAM-dependent methyltransferase